MHAVTNNRKVSCLVSGLWWAVMNPSTKWMQWVYIHISWAKSMGSELPNFLNKNRGELLLKYTFIFNKHIAMIKIKELCKISYRFSSVQFSHTVLSDSLWPHKPQHSRPPCPSPTPGVHPNPCPSSQWCHPAISSSVHLILILLLLPSIFPSIRVFSNESAPRIRWPKYWSNYFHN